ncbi:hypothetical protein [Saccharicrinis aurantiacus]|uniref:hypothetical protein n=1 Tax=Saccharicrinis aurantiacus TaxID=1849719 RepID=UPI0008393EC7|nr:hypothetical protein [Saccharicrinis aurantiacus]
MKLSTIRIILLGLIVLGNYLLSQLLLPNLKIEILYINLYMALVFGGILYIFGLAIKKAKDKTLIISIILTSVRFTMALIYLLPIILSNNPYKIQLSLVFMVNYLFYLGVGFTVDNR